MLDVALDGQQRTMAEAYQRRIVKVNADEPAYSIVRKLRAARVTMAVVLDPTGKQIGVVTWEDLIRRPGHRGRGVASRLALRPLVRNISFLVPNRRAAKRV